MTRTNPSTIIFNLVSYQGERLFLEPESGRAATVIEASCIRSESTFELWRDAKFIARATSTIAMCGDKSYIDILHGYPPLINGERAAERMVLRTYTGGGIRCAFSLKARSRGLHVNDLIVVRLGRGAVLHPSRKSWRKAQWLAYMTQLDRRLPIEFRLAATTGK